ncbi:MAG: transglycosylase domain-containing protein [Eubacteriaceae bacterium]
MKQNQTLGLKKRKKKNNIGIKILVVLLVLGILCIGVGYSIYAANRKDISAYEYHPKEKTEIYSSDNVLIAELYKQNRTNVTLDQIPVDLQHALIAVEDSRFYDHFGIDIYGIIRAFFSNVFSGGVGEGGSTITQQLSRVLFLPDIATEQNLNQSISRKLTEISISLQLEEKYSKEQILEMYFNEYYFGSGAYGIEEAAKTYFNKSVSEVNLAEAAMLAGLPQAPSAYAPNSDFEAAKARQLVVLSRMVKEKFITQEEADIAAATEIPIRDPGTLNTQNQVTPEYVAFVKQALNEYAKAKASAVMQERGISEDVAIDYIKDHIESGGYRLFTTINTAYQTNAIGSVLDGLDNYGMSDETGAVVSLDLDGAVMAYYGGDSEIDMANTPRQPGSNLKPLFYSAAIDKGIISANTTIADVYTDFGGYAPKNYDGGYHGNVSVRSAIVNSYNIPAVKVYDKLGPEAAVAFMEQMGISTFEETDYNLATALGGMTYGVKPLEMAGAFNTINNGGVYRQPYFLVRMEQINGGAEVYNKDTAGLINRKVMSDTTAATMVSILTDVVRGGTGSNAGQIYTTAGKTGTTNDDKDVWFTGMTGNLTTSIWIGAQENYVIGGGSYIPASIYGSYLRKIINQDLLAQPEIDHTSNEGSGDSVRALDSGYSSPSYNNYDNSYDNSHDNNYYYDNNTTTDTTTQTPDTTTPQTPDTNTPQTPDTTTPQTPDPNQTPPTTP